MRGYLCPGCEKYIGLVCDKDDKPGLYLCPHTQRVFGPQTPIKRETPKPPPQPAAEQPVTGRDRTRWVRDE